MFYKLLLLVKQTPSCFEFFLVSTRCFGEEGFRSVFKWNCCFTTMVFFDFATCLLAIILPSMRYGFFFGTASTDTYFLKLCYDTLLEENESPCFLMFVIEDYLLLWHMFSLLTRGGSIELDYYCSCSSGNDCMLSISIPRLVLGTYSSLSLLFLGVVDTCSIYIYVLIYSILAFNDYAVHCYSFSKSDILLLTVPVDRLFYSFLWKTFLSEASLGRLFWWPWNIEIELTLI